MTTLQEDLREIYNNLTVFNEGTLPELTAKPLPISVLFEKDSNSIVFYQKGVSVRLGLPLYYCLGLDSITKPTYLLPEDFDYMMSTLADLIAKGRLIEDRTCLSPENYGFDIYAVDLREFWKGPDLLGSVRFVSGNSWFFRLKVKYKYNL